MPSRFLAGHTAERARPPCQKVLPVDPRPHRLGGLSVGQVFPELHQRDQRQPPRRISRLAEGGIEVTEDGIVEHGAEPVTQEQLGVAARERRSSDGLRLRGNRRNRAMQAQRHGCHSYQSRTLNARQIPGSDFANSVRWFVAGSEPWARTVAHDR